MILQPSIDILLCDEATKTRIIPNELKYIEFTGERLTPTIKEKVESIFRCKSANQYGTKEVNSIAYECPCGRLHIMKDNVYVECIDENNNETSEGNIIVISKHNKAMPIIRYDTGDIGKIEKNIKCQCGQKGDVLSIIKARDNDLIKCPNMQKNAYILFRILDKLNKNTEGNILQYQIIQKDYCNFVVKLVVSEYYTEEMIEYITDEFSNILGYEIKVKVLVQDSILPMYKTGKHTHFICEIDE